MQGGIRQVSNVRTHARDGEATSGINALGEIAPAAPIRIRHDRLPADFVERDVLRRMPGGGRNRQRGKYPLRIARRPLQHLHAAHRAAGDREQRIDAQIVEQHRLRAYHVAHGDDRKIEAIRHACRRIGRGWTGRAHAAADHIRTNHEITVGIDGPAGSHHCFPPARLAGDRMVVDGVLIAGQRMADQHGIAALSVQLAVSLIPDLQRPEVDPGIQPQRIVRREAHNQRMRMVRLAPAVGQIEGRAQLCHNAFPDSGSCPNTGQKRVNRPPAGGVNVFFDFQANGTYQSSRSLGLAMPKEPRQPDFSLADLRRDIDRIDEAMHALLIERGEIIDRLIAVKKTQESGSAFRPAREADMMRRLVQRHHGNLPLDTVESIWRVIIATFTYVQAPFSAHADLSAGDALMRDSARFHFGFTVPLVPHVGAASVVEAVTESTGDLGLLPAFAIAGAGPWWTALEFDTAPKIIARLPFVERADHPAGLPVFVISRVAADAMVTEAEVWSMRVSGWSATSVDSMAGLADAIAVPDRAFDGAALLISVVRGGIDAVADALRGTGASIRSKAPVGSHASRYTVPSK